MRIRRRTSPHNRRGTPAELSDPLRTPVSVDDVHAPGVLIFVVHQFPTSHLVDADVIRPTVRSAVPELLEYSTSFAPTNLSVQFSWTAECNRYVRSASGPSSGAPGIKNTWLCHGAAQPQWVSDGRMGHPIGRRTCLHLGFGVPPQHELARKQPRGYGGTVSFRLTRQRSSRP